MQTKTGIITQCSGAHYRIRCTDNTCVVCKPRGNFRYKNLSLCVGDRVVLSIQEDGSALIEGILERKNHFLRPPIANLDCMIVVLSVKNPAPNLYQLDCLLAIAQSRGVRVLLVISKADLAKNEAQELADRYRSVGYEVLVSGTDASAAELLRKHLNAKKDNVFVFCGNSGVGKTTLCNHIFPSLALQTGEVSERTQRGRHTTRHVTLYPLSELLSDPESNGFLADTPGFGLIDFERFDFFDLEDLPHTFVEFAPYLSKCRYHDCTHTKEEGCAVLSAVKSGEILPSRHESFLELYAILKNKKKW